jgi:hypothetical protein
VTTVTELRSAAGETGHRVPWFLPDGVHRRSDGCADRHGSGRNPIGQTGEAVLSAPARGFFDAAADGQRFLLVERIDPDSRSITRPYGEAM